MVRICCVCHRIERKGRWEPVSLLVEDELVTHGYCPACYAAAMVEVEEFAGAMAIRELTVADRATMRGQWG